MWHGHLLPASLKFLKEQDADILLLQEVAHGTDPAMSENFRTLSILLDGLDYSYYDHAPTAICNYEAGKVKEGNAVLSRFPIVSHDSQELSGTFREVEPYNPAEFPVWPRNLQHVAVDANGIELNLFNFQGVWDLNGDNDSPQRQKMVDTILENIAGKPNVIVAGDTNAKPTNPAMRRLEKQLTNVFGNELVSTFNMRRKTNPGYATAVVDLMYVSSNISAVEKFCPDVDVSDHLPLVVTLEITEEKNS
jgi:endonuclease/exonuclease/phosphatase family metal-dependent hydrolase